MSVFSFFNGFVYISLKLSPKLCKLKIIAKEA